MRYLLVLLCCCLPFLSSAQDYMDIIAQKTCECSQKTVADKSKSAEVRQMELGFCIITEAAPYNKEIKHDYGIDLDRMNEETGEQLGQLIGLKMAVECPSIIMQLYGELGSDDDLFATSTDSEVTGKVRRVDEGQFYTLTLEQNDGKTTKLIWLTEAKVPAEYVENPRRLLGKFVEVEFIQQTLFDGRIKEYSNFNVITEIEIQ